MPPNSKRKRKPDYNKRNFIVGVVVAMLTAVSVFLAFEHSDSAISQTFKDGIGVVYGGIHYGSKTVINYFDSTRNPVSPVVSVPSPSDSVAWPAPQTPRPAVERPIADQDPYNYKATAAFAQFASGQDQDDYVLGRRLIANTYESLGSFTVRQVIAEGRTARQKTEAAQEIARQQKAAERHKQERLEAAQRQDEVAREHARQQEFAAHYWAGEPSCLLVEKDSLRTEEIENIVYATGVIRNTCEKDFDYVDVEVNFHNSDGSVEESALANLLNFRAGASWPWKIARQGLASGNWAVEKVDGM